MSNTKPNIEEKIWAAAAYVWILSLVVLASRKDNDYVRFHANQGALLFLISVVLMIVPLLGWLLNLIVVLVMVVGLVKALMGEKWHLPFIADMAKSFGDWIVKALKL